MTLEPTGQAFVKQAFVQWWSIVNGTSVAIKDMIPSFQVLSNEPSTGKTLSFLGRVNTSNSCCLLSV